MLLSELLSFNTIVFRNFTGPVAYALPLSSSYASRSLVAEGLTMPGTSERQKVRIMLWLAICGLLRIGRGSRVSMKYLMPLEHLFVVSTFDCAELGYCSLLIVCVLLAGN